MNEAQLLTLLQQKESTTLEFKKTWYAAVPKENHTKREQEKHEFIKDMLSLINGSIATAGETSYLIIGVGDKLENGKRPIIGLEESIPTTKDILQVLNAFCYPSVIDLLCETFIIEQKKVAVITIPPSLHIHEITQQLQTPKTKYTENTVFIRHESHISPANMQDRALIVDIKKARLLDQRNVPPTSFGAVTGAIVAWVLGTNDDPVLSVAKIIVGSGVGALLGNLCRSWYRMRQIAATLPGKWKNAFYIGLFVVTPISIAGVQKGLKYINPSLLKIFLGVSQTLGEFAGKLTRRN